jgi:hypothetical protein
VFSYIAVFSLVAGEWANATVGVLLCVFASTVLKQVEISHSDFSFFSSVALQPNSGLGRLC